MEKYNPAKTNKKLTLAQACISYSSKLKTHYRNLKHDIFDSF